RVHVHSLSISILPSATIALSILLFFFLLPPPPPSSTLFPYTTLFRSLLVLAVGHERLRILRRVQLADRGIDADLAEQSLHAEGARFVRHDRHDVATDVLVLEQNGERPHERHGGRGLALAGPLE